MPLIVKKMIKGNIMVSMLVTLMIVTMGISVCTAVIKDKHSTNLYVDRMNARTEINSHITMARNFIYSYFSNKKMDLMYRQTVEENAAAKEPKIIRSLVTDPYYLDVEDMTLSEYKGTPKYMLRSDEVLDFAGYKFNIKIFLDIPVNEIPNKLTVFNHSENFNSDFLVDTNDLIKEPDAYSVRIKDIPLIVVFEYDTWVQETKMIVSGLIFRREYFPILHYSLDDSLQGVGVDNTVSTATGVVDGYLISDYIEFETVESQRERA